MITLLLDADIIAYKAAALSEETYDFGDTGSAQMVFEQDCRDRIDSMLAEYCDDLGANLVKVCLTDTVNFRKQLDPSYKSNRAGSVKPELLGLAKEYLAHTYPSFIRPRLEADDVMGILATSGDQFIKGDKIIVSEDKDMRTIPANIYNPNKAELGVLEISPLDADRFHMWQTMTGDQTDGYPGCRGIGPASVYAEEIIGADREELWDIVLDAYASKGKTEADAILQARMAFILRAYAYDHRTRKIKLWSPLWLA